MKFKLFAVIASWMLAGSSALHAQPVAPQTEAELAKQTALLKAQQAYYDQLAATTKSQQAAADASVAAQAASLTSATTLETAQFTNDLALATALKGSGLPAAVGKDGSIAMAAAEKTLLALQVGSLEAVDALSERVCEELTPRLPKQGAESVKAFIAPANYDQLVQKSVADVVQLHSYRTAAQNGIQDFGSVDMQAAGTALAGAMVSAQYLAGGVQAISKLFRTDYNLTYTAANRQGLFESNLTAGCKGSLLNNVEGKLRQGAAKILLAWLPEMARFVQLHDMWAENLTQRKASLTARRAIVAADAALSASEKAAALKQIDETVAALTRQDEVLSKYKTVAAAIKTYLSSLGTSSVHDSLVWGQDFLHDLGGLPGDLVDLKLRTRPRLTYALSVQDASIRATSTFFPDKLRSFSTAELYYTLVDGKGDILVAGVHSMTTPPVEVKVKEISGRIYGKVR